MKNLDDLPLFENASREEEEEQVVVHSVSELNRQIKGILEGRYALVWLRGEISNFKAHTSGHHYFSLKDDKSQISAVMFRGYNRQLKFKPETGMEVLIRGRVTVYEPRGNYQIFCETMEPVGAGALQQAFEKLKKKLQGEGLFSPERKKELPMLPAHVALVTSPTGAAVKDMLNVLERRFKGLDVTIIPCQVQGATASRTIVEALEKVERLHGVQPVDVVICGRGGGSMEDLWAFNEEVLARKIADFPLPIISAVGHEIDFTIADFVADLRAPTPSAAAELVVKSAAELVDRVRVFERRLAMSVQQDLRSSRQKLVHLEKSLVDPKRYLQDLGIRCDELVGRLEMAALNYLSTRRMQVSLLVGKLERPERRLQRDRQRLESLESRIRLFVEKSLENKKAALGKSTALLDSLSPLRVVERGYSITTVGGEVVKTSTQLKAGDEVELRFAKGRAKAEIRKTFKE